MLTYSELFEFCIVVISLVSLCYQIFREKRK